jgi:hypothetical protein
MAGKWDKTGAFASPWQGRRMEIGFARKKLSW